ncbi:hypothetical protein [Nocardia aurantiaca]|uniref:Uncharacterized protein n=1 Tax=Nocardia aurantiaca TaxID=2675850 RepID=A0A6I3KNN4_9NOCA|nr:hypothetical protein [Nocardia aurantiaca]MTE11602.1 hypothetical protein [Nocardia aurantiaca]
MLEAEASPQALGLLRGIAWLTGGELSRAAQAAADRLDAAGTTAPNWAVRLGAPVRAVEFTRSGAEGRCLLMGSFERAGAIHGFLVGVHRRREDVAHYIVLFSGDDAAVEQQMTGRGLPGRTERLSPLDFRRELESALDRRARQDRADLHRGILRCQDPDADLPPYALAATVLRAHLRAIGSNV